MEFCTQLCLPLCLRFFHWYQMTSIELEANIRFLKASLPRSLLFCHFSLQSNFRNMICQNNYCNNFCRAAKIYMPYSNATLKGSIASHCWAITSHPGDQKYNFTTRPKLFIIFKWGSCWMKSPLIGFYYRNKNNMVLGCVKSAVYKVKVSLKLKLSLEVITTAPTRIVYSSSRYFLRL